MAEGILLESGTNEFEMLSFQVDNGVYGVNVSKVREIIKAIHITPIPGSDKRRLGIIMPREELISVIDLRYCLSGIKTEVDKCQYFIICHFNNLTTAFPVDNVKDIRRFSWNEIIEPSKVINTEDSMITGIIKTETEIVSVLDFESIVASIDISNGLTVADVEKITEKQIADNEQKNLHIVLAEDSKMLHKLITDSIEKVGYKITGFYNGEDALKYVKEHNENVDCIISDIEMPIRDGLSFLKELRNDDKIKDKPFVIFSSLIDEAMERKCFSLGADAVMTKPQLGNLIDTINDLVKGIYPKQKISKGY